MTVVEIFRERLPMHPWLGRHVRHDPRSRAYAVQPTATTLVATRHDGYIPILDQGQLGSCTGNAGVAAIYREPYDVVSPKDLRWPYLPDETGAVDLYSTATKLDGFAGSYPPDDTGSDGLSVAKALKAAGVISGYLHAFTLQSALLQLMSTPLITGITWYNSMFDVGDNGLLTVDPESGVAGGHELCVDEYVPAEDNIPAMVGGPNSWGTSWGAGGRWYMYVDDWQHLLANNGDVTAFVPAIQPAPTPAPDPSTAADADLWDATADFRAEHHHFPHIRRAATALHTWGVEKGFTS